MSGRPDSLTPGLCERPSFDVSRQGKKTLCSAWKKIAAMATERIYSQFMADLVVRKDVD